MTVGFMKSETCNSMGISFFDKPMALRALITLDKHASINTKRVATRLYIYCSVHSRGCKLLPIELIFLIADLLLYIIRPQEQLGYGEQGATTIEF
jgi:hypothetical protein